MNTPAPISVRAENAAWVRRASLPRAAAAGAGVVFFALLTAASARAALPLPGTPVPITLQTLAVVLAGAALGPWLGTASMSLYLLMGLAGLDAFAAPRPPGAPLLGVTGGYLLGFILAQPVVGCLTRGVGRPLAHRARDAALACAAAHAIIFATGLIWLAAWLRLDAAGALSLGFWPFLPGTVVKIAAVAGTAGLVAPLRRFLAR